LVSEKEIGAAWYAFALLIPIPLHIVKSHICSSITGWANSADKEGDLYNEAGEASECPAQEQDLLRIGVRSRLATGLLAAALHYFPWKRPVTVDTNDE
ncbi:hypothetical protein ACJX0J_024636, partial [Zea mays]